MVQRMHEGQFFGTVQRAHASAGFRLSETAYQPRQSVPSHAHDMAYFCVLVAGAYDETYGRQTVSYQPMSVAYHPPSEEHRGEISQVGGRVFFVEIDHRWLDRLRGDGIAPSRTVDLRGGELSWAAERLYREFQRHESRSDLIIEGLALEMLGALGRSVDLDPNRGPAWLAQVIDVLHAEFDQPLTVDAVARRIGVHPVHLSRVFRRYHRESLGEYLRRLRVQHAANRLAKSDIKLSEIAMESGFADQSQFSRVFKRATGFTPREFRSSTRARESRPRFTT